MWLLIPSSPLTDSPSSPAYTESSLDLKPRLKDIEPSAWWRGKPIAPGGWPRVLKKGQHLNLLGGITLEPSTANRGVESWISLLRASRVNRSPLPGSGAELTTNDGSGQTSSGSLRKPNRSRSSSKTFRDSCSTPPIAMLNENSWMTPQQTITGEWESYCGAWPVSGSMRNGIVSPRPTWVPLIDVSAFSSSPTAAESAGASATIALSTDGENQWATPNSRDDRNPGDPMGERSARKIREGWTVDLNDQASWWQTPTKENFRSRGGDRKDEPGLDRQSKMWTTPTAHDQHERYQMHAQGGNPLTNQVHMWSTPRKEDGESAGNHPGKSDSLTGQTAQWATPQSRDYRSGEVSMETAAKNVRPLNEQAVMWHTPHGMGNIDQTGKRAGAGGGELGLQANLWGLADPLPMRSGESSHQDPPIPNGMTCFCGTPGCALRSHKRKLNPLFVTWLMGWPIWWLASAPMPSAPPEMESYRYRLRLLLSCLLAGHK